LQGRILSELKLLADCGALCDNIQANMAMTISECYTIGFGAAHDSNEVIEWLLKAAAFGSLKATSWYHRTCHAIGVEPRSNGFTSSIETLESDLLLVPTESYLIMRIQRFAASIMQQAREIVALDRTTSDFLASTTYRVGIFNTWEIDELLPLHLAAWIGDDARVSTLLQDMNGNAVSASGFNAVHYACFGGQLSTLKILLNHNPSASVAGLHGITALHLSIFFGNGDLRQALDLLLAHGAKPDVKTTASVIWEDHDITLWGTPLDWAVRTRNHNLVHHLLRFIQGSECLGIAISHFFWEIAENLLQHFRDEGRVLEKSLYLFPIKRPFSHWIAHGQAHHTAIDKTVQICQKYQILTSDPEGNTDLMHCVNAALTEADFYLIEAILKVSSSLVVKHTNNDGFSALIYAISMAKHNNNWLKIVGSIAEFYSIEELQDIAMFSGSYLHLAVTNNSIVGARILLERGVNVNQPTFDEYQSTPLQLCMHTSGSTSMFSLLMEFGADSQTRDELTGATPFQTRLMGLQHDFALLDMASNQIIPEPIDGETLHGMLSCSMALKKMHHTDAREVFRHLLTSKNIDKHIDDTDERGVTLIQRAAYHLHIDSVRLLLEAGADASIPLDTGATQIVPLQIACSIGRLLWMSYASGEGQALREKREMAMGVATELLHWHQARGDDRFSGISELHLAACMTSTIDVQKCLANGENPDAKGRWPSIGHEVTPKELMEADLESEIEALESLRPQVSKDSEGSQDPFGISMLFDAISISATRGQIQASLMGSHDSSGKI